MAEVISGFDGPLGGLPARAAACSGAATALLEGNIAWSWGELDRFAACAAALLAEHGVQRGDRVVLLAPKSAWLVAVLFGVLRLGAVVVPVDVANPLGRIAKIVGDAKPTLVVTTETFARSRLDAVGALASATGAILLLDGLIAAAAERRSAPGPNDLPPSRQDDPALILYTSGSTGMPKGVMLSHSNVGAFAGWACSEFEVTPTDRIGSLSPLHFDLATFDLFTTALAGASVSLAPEGLALFPARLVEWLSETGVTVLYTVPSVLATLVDVSASRLAGLTKMRMVLFAGEVFPAGKLAALRHALPDVALANLFGPTETNVCSFYRIPSRAAPDVPLPIGRPAVNADLRIREDPARNPPGRGELMVSGPGVALGYWGDRDLSRRRFIDEGGRRTFATGDIVSRRADGQLLFHGREDDHVKIRGHRVALGEVEHVANTVEGVEAAAAILCDGQMLCFLMSREGDDIVDRVAAACRHALLPHMVPAIIRRVDRMPLGSTGKIDRGMLAHWSRNL